MEMDLGVAQRPREHNTQHMHPLGPSHRNKKNPQEKREKKSQAATQS